MLLVDAVFINNGGGKILLDYLIINLEKSNLEVCYLLDCRIEYKTPEIKASNKVIFIKGSFRQRHKFYIKNKKQFEKILCFGNVPPSIKNSSETFTYFHQILYLKTPVGIDFFSKIKIFIKTFIINMIAKNTNYWLVQSEVIKAGLIKKFNMADEQVILLPFYNIEKKILGIERKKDRFIYVSSGEVHKNQERLIKAFSIFYDEFKRGELHLTVSNEYLSVIQLIEKYLEKGYPIINHGYINQTELQYVYQSCEYSIYPSLTESFGLGIIEAIENDCKILGADLPYMHAVCKPSLTFNPFSVEEICLSFKKALEIELKQSLILVPNKINELIGLLNLKEWKSKTKPSS